MPPKFGTSGLRGLVVELTRELVQNHTRAFLTACPHGGGVYVGRDLRASSPEIANWVMEAAESQRVPVTDCGALPTPALAMASMEAGQAAVMVTGSHIPADRNGLKFYVPTGEISKSDEKAILSALGGDVTANPTSPTRTTEDAVASYVARYVDAFGATALADLRIGVYQHSSVARDVMVSVVSALGGDPLPLSRSETFIPVDTEAVDPDTRGMLAGWCSEHKLDAVISTDGDGDRPMVSDAKGQIVPGDVLGVVTARSLGAEIICTPVSCNTMVNELFNDVRLTRIGSPYVIAAMEQALSSDPAAKVVGYEANGGFLLGFEAQGPKGAMSPLLTRDCLLPILAPLAAGRAASSTLADLVGTLPERFTAADRIAGIATEISKAFIASLSADATARGAFFEGTESSVDETDGLRVTFASSDIVHLRPSGNAPEFRCYAEAATRDRASALVREYLAKLRTELG